MARKTKDTAEHVAPAEPDEWDDEATGDDLHEGIEAPADGTVTELISDEGPPVPAAETAPDLEPEPEEDDTETVLLPVADGVERLEVGAQVAQRILDDLGARHIVKHRVAENGKLVVVTSDPCRKFEYQLPLTARRQAKRESVTFIVSVEYDDQRAERQRRGATIDVPVDASRDELERFAREAAGAVQASMHSIFGLPPA